MKQKKRIILTMFIFVFLFGYFENAISKTTAKKPKNKIQSLILQSKDLPEGMVLGKIPKSARKLIKRNPWILDRASIKKFSRAIYSGANYYAISRMAMVILTSEQRPYDDDVVYYVFEYKTESIAKRESQKIADVKKYNPRRAEFLHSERFVILVFCDNEELFPQLQEVTRMLKQKLY